MSQADDVLLGRAELERAFTALGERLARRSSTPRRPAAWQASSGLGRRSLALAAVAMGAAIVVHKMVASTRRTALGLAAIRSQHERLAGAGGAALSGRVPLDAVALPPAMRGECLYGADHLLRVAPARTIRRPRPASRSRAEAPQVTEAAW